MIEDLGLAETHMNEAVPNMGVEEVWAQYGYDGTGVTIAVLDTGVRGDQAGLDDMDDENDEGYKFVRIGEEPDDVDQRGYGYGHIQVVRSVQY